MQLTNDNRTNRSGLKQTSINGAICTFLQIATTLGSTSIRYRSDTFASDRYLIDIDQWAFAIRVWSFHSTDILSVIIAIFMPYPCKYHIVPAGFTWCHKYATSNNRHTFSPERQLYFRCGIWVCSWAYIRHLDQFTRNLIPLILVA